MTCTRISVAEDERAPNDAPALAGLAYVESPTWITCGDDRMLGIKCGPIGRSASRRAVLIVVGGPQYRVGSHRQFVLLARRLAHAGYVSLRFDYRGMGDSEGEPRTFETIGEDLDAAIDFLCAQPGIRSVVIWALCDAASAALMFCGAHPRVSGFMLLNPWVRSESTLATAQLKHYYGQRLLEREFWSRLVRAQFDWRASLRGLYDAMRRAMRRSRMTDDDSFQARMAEGWRRFRGPILLALSGRDLTAKEFVEHAATDSRWRGLLERGNVRRIELAGADHTFSSAQWHAWLEDQTIRWLDSVEAGRASPRSLGSASQYPDSAPHFRVSASPGCVNQDGPSPRSTGQEIQ